MTDTSRLVAERTCWACDVSKPLSAFVKDSRRSNGIDGICRPCKRMRDALRWRAKYSRSAEFRASFNKQRGIPRKGYAPPPNDPVKARAQRMVRNAVYSGRLVKPENCEDCGAACVAHGHHEDYSKPLDVNWLCAACHMRRHRKYSGIAASSTGDAGEKP